MQRGAGADGEACAVAPRSSTLVSLNSEMDARVVRTLVRGEAATSSCGVAAAAGASSRPEGTETKGNALNQWSSSGFAGAVPEGESGGQGRACGLKGDLGGTGCGVAAAGVSLVRTGVWKNALVRAVRHRQRGRGELGSGDAGAERTPSPRRGTASEVEDERIRENALVHAERRVHPRECARQGSRPGLGHGGGQV